MRKAFCIPVRLGAGSYTIRIGFRHLQDFGPLLRKMNLGTHPVVLSNARILRCHGCALWKSLGRAGFSPQALTIADSERSKSVGTLGRVLVRVASLDGPGKRLFLILAGGGVVGDLGGVVAGLYRRGIPFVQLPTTLLAQVDSAVGGKTGVDLPQGKNLAGLFYQPRLVFVETGFLSTLSDRQFRSGLAEALKCGVIGDPGLFGLLEKVTVDRLRRDAARLTWVIARAVRLKARVVAQDERETRGIRTILNFGHTLGHALEAAAGYRQSVAHGEAVALGMRAASEISCRLGLVSGGVRDRICRAIDHLGLPSRIHGVGLSAILKAMSHDKKWVQAPHRWVLPTGIGRCTVREGVPDSVVRAAIRGLMEIQGGSASSSARKSLAIV